MQNRQQLTGYVLHKRPYRETSVLVDFFSLEQGRVSAVAKGARGNAKSDRKSLLQPFQKLEFELSGRSQLKNLGRLDALQSANNLKKTALYCAFYINEILVRALPESEPIAEVFVNYELTFSKLVSLQSEEISLFEPILREFEFTLLQALGYLPDFTCDAASGSIIQGDEYYVFDVQNGFSLSHSQVKHAIKGEYIKAVAQSEYTHSDHIKVKQVAKYICRLALVEVIGSKPIKSRELFI
jgi:DNA repair protein RecO (recombination protein O)